MNNRNFSAIFAISAVILVGIGANISGASQVLPSDVQGLVMPDVITQDCGCNNNVKLESDYPGFVKGFVYNATTMKGIKGAEIKVCGIGMIDTSFATTKSGAYFLELTAGTHTVVASANGFIPVSKNIGISVL